MSGAAPATDIAGILAAPNSCARPSHAGLPGSVAELSCQKIVLDLQLANLSIQKIDLSFIDGSLRRSSTLEDARRTVQQLLLPVVDLVGMDPELPRQLGDGPVALDRRQRHLGLEPRAVLLPCPLHVLLLRYPRFLGAGFHLSHLSHFRGPAHGTGQDNRNCSKPSGYGRQPASDRMRVVLNTNVVVGAALKDKSLPAMAAHVVE